MDFHKIIFIKFFKLQALALIALLLSCEPRHDVPTPKNSFLRSKPSELCNIRSEDNLAVNDEKKLKWLDKTVRMLSGGKGLRSDELQAKFSNMTRPQIIQNLMDQKEFADFVLDFNMYFLGFKIDSLKEKPFPNFEERYSERIFSFPNAIASAVSVQKCESFDDLFQLYQKIYVPPLNQPFDLESENSQSDNSNGSMIKPEDKPTPQEIREKLFKKIDENTSQLIGSIKSPSPPNFNSICQSVFDLSGIVIQNFTAIGVNFEIVQEGPVFGWLGQMLLNCQIFRDEKFDFLSELESIKVKNKIFYERLLKFDSEKYKLSHIIDAKFLELDDLSDVKPTQFTTFHAAKLNNSSTNQNRKRAAYILSRFFCDDLTPINVEEVSGSDSHSKGRHGTEKSCYSCHHRLDPMAGYFKDIGIQFVNFSKFNQIVFDDQATENLTTYQENWKADPSSGREWNIGYVRSVTDHSKNSYGETLEDLFKTISVAPEVKQCLVKRMFQYLVSEEQMIDSGYLIYLTKQYENTAQYNSSLAFKELVGDILLANTILESDLNPKKCYDFSPEQTGTKGLPCQVSYLIEKNCITCHSKSNTQGDLNMGEWITISDGHNFPHKKSGKQLSVQSTFRKIQERLTTSDNDLRMPYKKYMSSHDREALFKWTNDVLKGKVK